MQTPGAPTAMPSVHVVMCTYEPDLTYFDQQLASVLAQEDVRLSVTISDDGSSAAAVAAIQSRVAQHSEIRFMTGDRLGVFHNFERGLQATPWGVDAVLLCDQDDVWSPSKARELVDALAANPAARLVHSDARLIDQDGTQLGSSMFASEQRDVDHLDVDHLMLKNVVTGCTAALRPDLLRVALPFPTLGPAARFHHDLWLALCAAGTGEVVTLRRPLLDYRQHRNNVIGVEPAPRRWRDLRRAVVDWRLRRHVAEVVVEVLDAGQIPAGGPLEAARKWAGRLGAVHVLALAFRWGLRRDPQASFALLLGIVGLGGVLRSATIDHLPRSRAQPGAGTPPMMRTALRILRDPDARRRAAGRLAREAGLPALGFDLASPHHHVVRPLRHRLDPFGQRRTVHVLVPFLPRAGVFGGVATALRLAVQLAHEGTGVHIVETDRTDRLTDDELRDMLVRSLAVPRDWVAGITVTPVVDPDDTLVLGVNDVFLATAWWTAHRAAATARAAGLPEQRFVYLIQDFEPSFYGGSDEQAMARSSYDLACWPVVNCSTLAAQVQSSTDLDLDAALILAPQVDVPSLAALPRTATTTGPLRVLFYGRPSVPRNLFETAGRGLGVWLRERQEPREVLAVSVGEAHGPVDLGGGHHMLSMGQLSWRDYERVMSQSHIGLSLMLSPHPSYPPLEMAAAGLVVVTNRHPFKDLSTVSPRFISCSPSPSDVARALAEAEGLLAQLQDEGRAYDLAQFGRPLAAVARRLSVLLRT